MAKRVTITLDDDLVKKLHKKQSQLIIKSPGLVSFSSVLNNFLREGLKKA